MIWTHTDVEFPALSVAIAVILGCDVSLPLVEMNATIDSPEPMPPVVEDTQSIVTRSPSGSETTAESATLAPKSFLSLLKAAVCDDRLVGETISRAGGPFGVAGVAKVVVVATVAVVVGSVVGIAGLVDVVVDIFALVLVGGSVLVGLSCTMFVS